MIVLLSNCFINLQSKASGKQDSVKVLIDVELLRSANVKLNERLHLLKLTKLQDSLLIDHKNKNIIQDSINLILNNKINSIDKINKELNEKLTKSKKKYSFWRNTTIGVVITFIITTILN